ncbi:unnamed protein product, partial [Allacma fusca]
FFTGFSFAANEDAYANNSDEEAAEIYEALKQFFTLFSDFQPRDFYLAGETYAATQIPYEQGFSGLHWSGLARSLKIPRGSQTTEMS